MLNIRRTDHVTLAEIYKQTNRSPLINKIRMRQLGWLGHTMRLAKDEPTKMLALYEPSSNHGKHKRGAKQLSYIKQISQILGGDSKFEMTPNEIESLAKNRNEWRKRVNGQDKPPNR